MATHEPRPHTALQLWESFQVELQGRYSIERFRELLAHAKTSSRLGNVATVLAAPVPVLLVLLAIDALPLEPPSTGLHHQTPGFFVRLFVISGVATVIVARQIHYSAPTLPLSSWHHLLLAAVPAIGYMSAFCAVAMLWIFPIPFSLSLVSSPGMVVAFGCLWWMWKGALATNADTKMRVMRFLKVLSVQNSLVGAYIAYYALFTLVQGDYQTYVSILLPIMKLVFKNMVRSGLYYLEDLAPSIVVTNIDVFHAAFVCRTLGQAKGRGAIGFIMVVDAAQSAVAYYGICSTVRRINIWAEQCRDNDKYASSNNARGKRLPTSSWLASALKMNLGVIDYALYLIDTYPSIRDDPTIALPRHARQVARAASSATEHTSRNPTTTLILPSCRVLPVETRPLERVAVQPQTVPTLSFSSSPLSPTEQSQLRCVESTLKMLHMVEFYVLIEFVEFAIAAIFALYMWALSHMDNRVYYAQLRGLSDVAIQSMIQQLTLYAVLELVSFVLLCILFDCHLQHISTVQQLAFVLQKHWKTVVPTMVFWVFMNVQLTLEHFGIDFTFQFKWTWRRGTGV